MIDASAKIPNGIYEGNLVDYGNFEECLSVKDDERSIRGQHCMLKLQIPQKIFNLLTNDSKFKINLLNARVICLRHRKRVLMIFILEKGGC